MLRSWSRAVAFPLAAVGFVSWATTVSPGASAQDGPAAVRIGAWNIEWLGQPGNRSGIARNQAQSAEDLAAYIAGSRVSILALEEVCDDEGDGSRRTNSTLDAAMDQLNDGSDAEWRYLLFSKRRDDDIDQHTGVAWNAAVVTLVDAPFRLPADNRHREFSLLERAPHAAKFSLGAGRTDVVVIPLHLKSNRGGASRTRQQRHEEAVRIADVIDEVTSHFEDEDILLLGDFNVLSAAEPAVGVLTRAGFVDLNADDEPTTWQGDAPFDRAFVVAGQGEMGTAPVEVFSLGDLTPAEHKTRLSDHYMVVTAVEPQADDDGPGAVPRVVAIAEAVPASSGLPATAGQQFPDYDEHHPPPAGVDTFELSQGYPATYRVGERFPWEAVDYRLHPQAYANAVLKYCLEGNVEERVDFRVELNSVRRWYHAPWLDNDGDPRGAGREYLRGLTRERRSRPGELHPRQTDYGQNWAVGFYNDRGGYTLGKVWHTIDGNPNPAAANFPPQTVAFKLLFTDASVDQVPYLRDSKEWTANIYADTNYRLPRLDRVVRLLQIDIAVKDPRAAADSGWVFGTFVYDASRPGRSPFDRMVYVGLSWHDDDRVASRLCTTPGDNPELTGTVLNGRLLDPAPAPETPEARMYHTGLGGRLNGPVDNPHSSCISCHGRAALLAPNPAEPGSPGMLMPFFNATATSPADFDAAALARYFRTIPAGSHLEEDQGRIFVTVDYSQQLAAGIRNFYAVGAGGPGAALRDGTGADATLPKANRGD